jgi:peroxiredoxin Q/BCP
MYGNIKMGVVRSTFIIDNDGKIIQEFRNIKAKGHALKIYNYIKDEIL